MASRFSCHLKVPQSRRRAVAMCGGQLRAACIGLRATGIAVANLGGGNAGLRVGDVLRVCVGAPRRGAVPGATQVPWHTRCTMGVSAALTSGPACGALAIPPARNTLLRVGEATAMRMRVV